MRENTDQNNSEYGHFLRSERYKRYNHRYNPSKFLETLFSRKKGKFLTLLLKTPNSAVNFAEQNFANNIYETLLLLYQNKK